MTLDTTSMIDCFRRAAVDAGRAILRIREKGVAAELKADDTPVTLADRQAEAIILDRLAAAWPQIGYLAEEACSMGHQGGRGTEGFFLIDPLDGTREFIAGRDEFTVNIAYVRAGRPLLGVVHVPATGATYAGSPDGAFAWDGPDTAARPLAARPCPAGGAVALVSRSHRTPATQAWLAANPPARIVPMGSSLKFCRIAEGEADIYPCFGTTMEWDTAAGEAVLVAAGGHVATPQGLALAYGKHEAQGRAGFANPHFIARGLVSR